MSEFSGLWKHENNQCALVLPKTECGCPNGGGIKYDHIHYPSYGGTQKPRPPKNPTKQDFVLSLPGLKSAKYTTPTDIQKQAVSAALQGKDVLGAAKTGSGKTLAFLIPVSALLTLHPFSPCLSRRWLSSSR